MQKTVYLAGKITGDPYFYSKFLAAKKQLTAAGFLVMSPAELMQGFPYEAYKPINKAMIDACDTVCFLPDWTNSEGAIYEMGYALSRRKWIFMYDGNAEYASALASGTINFNGWGNDIETTAG